MVSRRAAAGAGAGAGAIASARQATYATVRRSGAALITFRAGREEKVAPHVPGAWDPASPGGAPPERRRRTAGTTGTRAGARWAGRGPAVTRIPGAAGTASTASRVVPAASRWPARTAARPRPDFP